MFRKGEKVVYPIQGIATISKIEEIEFNGNKQSYYKLDFPLTSLKISVPKENADDIGLRKPLKKEILIKEISVLSKSKVYSERELEDLVEKSQELLNSGSVKDSVSLISKIRAWKKIRKKDGKPLTTSMKSCLNIAQDFLKQEVKHVLGENSLKIYGLE